MAARDLIRYVFCGAPHNARGGCGGRGEIDGLGTHPGLRHGDGGPGAAGAERISGRRKPNPESPIAYAERWVRSVKHECLSKVILFGERSLRRALSEYVEHYHAERNHQARAISCCSLETRTSAANSPCNAASASAGSCVITIKRRHERAGRLK